MQQDDWFRKCASLMDTNMRLMSEHQALMEEHELVLKQLIDTAERATELENLIERYGLCSPKVPESFEEWQQQQKKGGE